MARDALVAAALCLCRPNMAAAMILTWTVGQQQGDLLKLVQTRYDEIKPYEADDPAVYARLAAREPDGRVMGIRLRQGKTNRWVGVPIVSEARQQLEAAVAGARALDLTTILYDEERARTADAPGAFPTQLRRDPGARGHRPDCRRRYRTGGRGRGPGVPRLPPDLRGDDGPARHPGPPDLRDHRPPAGDGEEDPGDLPAAHHRHGDAGDGPDAGAGANAIVY